MVKKTLLTLSLLLSASWTVDASNRLQEIEESLTMLKEFDPSGMDRDIQRQISTLLAEQKKLMETSSLSITPSSLTNLKTTPPVSDFERLKKLVLSGNEVSSDEVSKLGFTHQMELVSLISEKETVSKQKKVETSKSKYEQCLEKVLEGTPLNRQDLFSLKDNEQIELLGLMENMGMTSFNEESETFFDSSNLLSEEVLLRETQDRAYEQSLALDRLKERMKDLEKELEDLSKTLSLAEETYKFEEEKALSKLRSDVENLKIRIATAESRFGKLDEKDGRILALKEKEALLQSAEEKFHTGREEQIQTLLSLRQKKLKLESELKSLKLEKANLEEESTLFS